MQDGQGCYQQCQSPMEAVGIITCLDISGSSGAAPQAFTVGSSDCLDLSGSSETVEQFEKVLTALRIWYDDAGSSATVAALRDALAIALDITDASISDLQILSSSGRRLNLGRKLEMVPMDALLELVPVGGMTANSLKVKLEAFLDARQPIFWRFKDRMLQSYGVSVSMVETVVDPRIIYDHRLVGSGGMMPRPPPGTVEYGGPDAESAGSNVAVVVAVSMLAMATCVGFVIGPLLCQASSRRREKVSVSIVEPVDESLKVLSCICGNILMPDAEICQKCGEKRPEEVASGDEVEKAKLSDILPLDLSLNPAVTPKATPRRSCLGIKARLPPLPHSGGEVRNVRSLQLCRPGVLPPVPGQSPASGSFSVVPGGSPMSMLPVPGESPISRRFQQFSFMPASRPLQDDSSEPATPTTRILQQLPPIPHEALAQPAEFATLSRNRTPVRNTTLGASSPQGSNDARAWASSFVPSRGAASDAAPTLMAAPESSRLGSLRQEREDIALAAKEVWLTIDDGERDEEYFARWEPADAEEGKHLDGSVLKSRERLSGGEDVQSVARCLWQSAADSPLADRHEWDTETRPVKRSMSSMSKGSGLSSILGSTSSTSTSDTDVEAESSRSNKGDE